MLKSMYSLILSDAVIERIDQAAYRMGISRSQLIDQLLAEKVGLHTPEQKLRMIIEQVAQTIGQETPLKVHVRSDMAGMQFATYLHYKYNPGIQYHMDFQNENGHLIGMLKVSSRSTSEDLLTHLTDFFRMLSRIDTQRFEQFYHLPVSIQLSQASNNKFVRVLISPQMSVEDGEEIKVANYLSNYIRMLDDSLQCYFQNLGGADMPARIDRIYCHYLEDIEGEGRG